MKSRDSHRAVLRYLWHVYQDISIRCAVDLQKDYSYCKSRLHKEGFSFLALTLPNLSDALERGFRNGFIDESDLIGFRIKKGTAVPLLLGSLFLKVFHESGHLRDRPCPDAVFGIRQISRLFKKIEIDPSSHAVRAELDKYRKTDEEVGSTQVEPLLLHLLRRVSGVLYSTTFSNLYRQYLDESLRFRHGNGAVSSRHKGPEKYEGDWNAQLQEHFPVDKNWSISSEFSDQPVRVTTVPKTLKGPRIIAVEPISSQYVQQGLMGSIYDSVERDPLLSCVIGFRDQLRNRELCRKGSIDGSYATIDLSEASDRLSLDHVRCITASDAIYDILLSCRTPKALMPNGDVIELNKFSSMGSALCFPLETMVFLGIVCVAVLLQRKRSFQIDHDDIMSVIKWLPGNVSVFGDDIIVPSECAEFTMETLEAFGLVVNTTKSFTSGPFRESCGADYLHGYWVTPVYTRQSFPDNRKDPRIISLVELGNNHFQAGNWHTAYFIREYVEELVGPLPTGRDLPFLHHFDYQTSYRGLRSTWNADLQYQEFTGLAPSSRKKAARFTTDWGRLHYSLTEPRSEVLPGIRDIPSGPLDEYQVKYSTRLRRTKGPIIAR